MLFKRDMFHATVISRTKTKTRRTHGIISDINSDPGGWKLESKDGFSKGRLKTVLSRGTRTELCVSKYKVGEILYIAEPMWVKSDSPPGFTALEIDHYYQYDFPNANDMKPAMKKDGYKSVSPLLMRQEYGRYFIQIREIDFERVQDITDEDILLEGIPPPAGEIGTDVLRAQFATLFDRVNTPGTWARNPFNWVYKFDYLDNYKRRDTKC